MRPDLALVLETMAPGPLRLSTGEVVYLEEGDIALVYAFAPEDESEMARENCFACFCETLWHMELDEGSEAGLLLESDLQARTITYYVSSPERVREAYFYVVAYLRDRGVDGRRVLFGARRLDI